MEDVVVIVKPSEANLWFVILGHITKTDLTIADEKDYVEIWPASSRKKNHNHSDLS